MCDRWSLQKRCGWSWTQRQRGACCSGHHRSHRQGAGEQATGQGLRQLLGESQRALQQAERETEVGSVVRQVQPLLACPGPFPTLMGPPTPQHPGLTASSAAPLGFL